MLIIIIFFWEGKRGLANKIVPGWQGAACGASHIRDSEIVKSFPSTLQNDGAVTTGREVTQFGISHKQSSTFQQIADIPETDFEEFIQEKKQAVNNAVAELTTTIAEKRTTYSRCNFLLVDLPL